MKTIYICAVQYRDYNRKIRQRVHTMPFETLVEAQVALSNICDQYRAMGWIIATECPPFVPPLRAVGPGLPDDIKVIGLDEHGNQVT